MIPAQYIIWVVVFSAATFFIYGFLEYRGNRRTIKGRIDMPSVSSHAPILAKKEHSLKSWLAQLLTRWGSIASKDEKTLSAARQQLTYAGFRNANAPLIYFGLRVLASMLLPLPYLFSKIIQANITSFTLLYAFLLAGIGYMLPQFLLKLKVRQRQNNIDRALPDVLDLFIICAEAGLALPAAVNKVAGEIKNVSQDFCDELQLTALELRTGIPWDVALHHLGERTGVQSVKSFVSLLIQTDKLGTNIAQAMRTHADFVRTQRALKAEELANKLPVKMLFPLAFFIFPGIMIVAGGPGVIKLFRVILPILQNTQFK